MVYKRKTLEPELFYGAKPEIFEKAKELRKKMTEAEQLLWFELRRNQFHGYYFRRQHLINQFIADFYCHELRLVIEIDGSVHIQDEQKEYDEGRTHEMKRYGINVLRFTNEQINTDVHKVLTEIEKYLRKP